MSSIILVKYLLLEETIRHFREYRFYVRLRGSTGGGSAGNDVYAREIERYRSSRDPSILFAFPSRFTPHG